MKLTIPADASQMEGIWKKEDIAKWSGEGFYKLSHDYVEDKALSQYNPTPGTGRTGFYNIPPNNYPFYQNHEKYKPKMQQDGGQWSDPRPMYAPSNEQAELDREKAYARGVPFGLVAGDGMGEEEEEEEVAPVMLKLTVRSMGMFREHEYGLQINPDGSHSGGPFVLEVPSTMRVDELRVLIQQRGGIPVALQKLSYAGKRLMDPNRTLRQYGIEYWHKYFPHWEIKLLSL